MPGLFRSLLASVLTVRRPTILLPIATALLGVGIGTRIVITETEITIIGAIIIAIGAEVIVIVIVVVIEIGGVTTPLEDKKIKISIEIKG